MLAARSRFAGAVTLTVATPLADKVADSLATLSGTRLERRARGGETNLHIFALSGASDGLLEMVRAHIADANWPVQALALETGRLDDVFGQLTGKPRHDDEEARA